MKSKILNQFLWRIFFCLATLSLTLAIPTTFPTVNTKTTQLTESQIREQNSTNEETIHQIKSENNQEIQVSNEITETKSNKSVITPTSVTPVIELDPNNRIDSNSPVDQLTELSADQINTPSLETKFGNKAIVSDETQTRVPSTVSPTEPMITSTQNKSNESDNLNNTITQENNITSTTSANSALIKNENMTVTVTAPTLTIANQNPAKEDNHRNKRSFSRSSLHSNLDELLNMKRQRRASMRSKRNTNYDDILASLLAAEEAKYNDNYYDTYPDKNELNALAMNYILSTINSGDSDNKNIDLDKLSQYYYENLLPLIDSIDTDSDSTSDEDNQELPIIVQPYTQSVIPVMPYSLSNRYNRIRRSYYDRYRNPISVYTGLKRKRSQRGSGWGRIVGANSDRSTYEDEAQEANKIYSLASLLATGKTPEENRLRYKRSVNRLVKPIVSFKNM